MVVRQRIGVEKEGQLSLFIPTAQHLVPIRGDHRHTILERVSSISPLEGESMSQLGTQARRFF
jgi:hypothetical protein